MKLSAALHRPLLAAAPPRGLRTPRVTPEDGLLEMQARVRSHMPNALQKTRGGVATKETKYDWTKAHHACYVA